MYVANPISLSSSSLLSIKVKYITILAALVSSATDNSLSLDTSKKSKVSLIQLNVI